MNRRSASRAGGTSPSSPIRRSIRERLCDRATSGIAARLSASAAQVALAWLLRRKRGHRRPASDERSARAENRAALNPRLGKTVLAELDRAFAPPRRKRPLETT